MTNIPTPPSGSVTAPSAVTKATEVAKKGNFKEATVSAIKSTNFLPASPAVSSDKTLPPDKSLTSRLMGSISACLSYLGSYLAGSGTAPSQDGSKSGRLNEQSTHTSTDDAVPVREAINIQKDVKPSVVSRKIVSRKIVSRKIVSRNIVSRNIVERNKTKYLEAYESEKAKHLVSQAQIRKQQFSQTLKQVRDLDSHQIRINQTLNKYEKEISELKPKSNIHINNDVFIKKTTNKHFAESELKSYKLSQLLGLDGLVPATVVKDNRVASVLISGTDADELDESSYDQVLCKDKQLFDFITGQSDRTDIYDDDQELSKNMLVLPNHHVVLIDNEFSFEYNSSAETRLPGLTPSSIKEIFYQDENNFLTLLIATQHKSEIANWIFDRPDSFKGASEDIKYKKNQFIARMTEVEQELKNYIEQFMGESVLNDIEEVINEAP